MPLSYMATYIQWNTDGIVRKRYSFWIDDQQANGLKVVKDRDGVLASEQIRRAIDRWLGDKGVTVKTRKRDVRAPRKRPRK